jgi:hypothetical protein
MFTGTKFGSRRLTHAPRVRRGRPATMGGRRPLIRNGVAESFDRFARTRARWGTRPVPPASQRRTRLSSAAAATTSGPSSDRIATSS